MDRRRLTVLGALAVVATAMTLFLRDCGSASEGSLDHAAATVATPLPAAPALVNRETVLEESLQEDSNPEATFAVRVVGGSPLAPIYGAYVGPVNHGSAWPADAQGIALLDSSLRSRSEWFVDHERWQRWQGALPEPGEDGVIEIQLETGGVIEGRLVGEEVVREWRELRVLVRSEPRDPYEYIISSVPDTPWIEATVKVDSAGAFRIQGLKRELAYTVYAGGGGCISPLPLRAITPDAFGLELEVLPLWGLQLEFRRVGGEAMRTHPDLRTYHAFSRGMPDRKDAVMVPPEHPALSLLGIRPTAYFERSLQEQLMLYAAPVGEALHVQCGVTHAGYARWYESIELLQCRHSVPRVVIELEEVASGWGQLTVIMDGLPANAPWSQFCRDVDLVLWPVEPAMREANLMLAMILPRPEARTGTILDGVPSGVYRVEAYGLHELGLWTKWGPNRDMPEVLVPPGGAATVTVDWSQHGHAMFHGPMPSPITIRPVGRTGRPWTQGGGRDSWARFAGLAPGAYEYSTSIARHPSRNEGPWLPFSVTAGTLTVVQTSQPADGPR